MEFYVTSATDTGVRKAVNQDSIFVRRVVTNFGRLAFAVLCDGMGGLEHGEIASAQVVSAFSSWMYQRLPILLNSQQLSDHVVREEWSALIEQQHLALLQQGMESGSRMGTTATVLLLTESRYYLLSIGDSRAYLLKRFHVEQLTVDHTVANREIALGNLTPEQAEVSPIRSVLTRCVGVGEYQAPDMFFGTPEPQTAFLLCSDGFRHCVSPEEICTAIFDTHCLSATELRLRCEELIALNIQRGESDNISVITVFCT